MLFTDRVDAGRQLAAKLTAYANRSDVIVLALPRGGVPVAAEVAAHLHAQLDVFLVRKLGAPGQPELAIGAIAAGGAEVLSRELIDELDIPPGLVETVIARERVELSRRDRAFRGNRPSPVLRGRIVILVDDGLATGATMEAAVVAIRRLEPARLVVAVPVASSQACERLRKLADELVSVAVPPFFSAVGQWYDDFSQTTDDEVRQLLDAAESSPNQPFT
jgi:predicted phosphoribosyltransferase